MMPLPSFFVPLAIYCDQFMIFSSRADVRWGPRDTPGRPDGPCSPPLPLPHLAAAAVILLPAIVLASTVTASGRRRTKALRVVAGSFRTRPLAALMMRAFSRG
jgi:hypothetical protein